MNRTFGKIIRILSLNHVNSFHSCEGLPNTMGNVPHSGLKLIVCFFYVAALFLIYGHTVEAAQTIKVSQGDEWHYKTTYRTKKGKVPSRWTHIGFDDSGWRKGPMGIGYGRSAVSTDSHKMRGNFSKINARRKFFIPNPSKVDKMILSVVCDGAFIAYINGIEVIRNDFRYAPPGQASENNQPEPLDISGFAHELLRGENVLSVQCSNDNPNSEGFSFIPLFEVHEKGGIQ
jgi:hypothetical protein